MEGSSVTMTFSLLPMTACIVQLKEPLATFFESMMANYGINSKNH